ncbi:DDB1- and CUL4-associated factor 17 [Clupea harengus]|uniref:DDB1- and CUL4-associated factor 17 n=1 Tax=Clupea harengus TaxID=7950 RepID=A0A6P8GK57_CLUHA|nr:DDB1- and CUL4-associated factor 17 [Clupea harengus]
MCPKQTPSQQRPLARKLRSSKNVCHHMDLRSKGLFSNDAGCGLRRNLGVLREILLNDDAIFKEVWTKMSKSPISYESGRLYFENYRCCYTSQQAKPRLMYELPKCSKAEKIEDALFLQSPLGRTLPSSSDQQPSLLALSANSWLCRISPDTGDVLQRVYLSPQHKFRYLSWDDSQETIYAKSIQKKPSALARQAGLDVSVLMHLAVFRVFPLKLIGVLEISKQVFGNTVVDVALSQGVLVVSHSTKCVRLYSFERIIHMFRTKELVVGEPCDLSGTQGIVGEPPLGIPVNIHITEAPPVLFEVSYHEGIQIGGNPFHFIYTPSQKKHRGTHHICSLKDGTLAKNGVQDMNCCSLESDWILFHPDQSGRIIHVGPNIINVLKILTEWGGDNQSEIAKDFSITAQRDQNRASQVTVTSSGRTVKRRVHQLDDDPEHETFRMVDYEDELDLLTVVVTRREESGEVAVCLHDNNNGTMMKRILLQESWDETYSHQLILDRDTIVHIEQGKNNNFCCHVYKMTPRHIKE